MVSSVQDLVSLFNFHNYDNLRHFAKKLDPRREGGDQRVRLLHHFISILVHSHLFFLLLSPPFSFLLTSSKGLCVVLKLTQSW